MYRVCWFYCIEIGIGVCDLPVITCCGVICVGGHGEGHN